MTTTKQKPTTLEVDIPKATGKLSIADALTHARTQYCDAVRDAVDGDVDGIAAVQACQRLGRSVDEFEADVAALKRRRELVAELESNAGVVEELAAANRLHGEARKTAKVEIERVTSEKESLVKSAGSEVHRLQRIANRRALIQTELMRTMPAEMRARYDAITSLLDPSCDMMRRIVELETRQRMTDGAIQAAVNRPHDAEIAERGEHAKSSRVEILDSLRPLLARRDALIAERLEIEQRSGESWPGGCNSIR